MKKLLLITVILVCIIPTAKSQRLITPKYSGIEVIKEVKEIEYVELDSGYYLTQANKSFTAFVILSVLQGGLNAIMYNATNVSDNSKLTTNIVLGAINVGLLVNFTINLGNSGKYYKKPYKQIIKF